MLAPLIVSMPVWGFSLTTVLSCSLWAFVTLPKDLFQLDLHISTVPLLYPFGFVPRPSPLNVCFKPSLPFHVPFESLLTCGLPVLPLDVIQVYGSRGRAHRFDTGIRVWACVWVNSSRVSNALWHTAVTCMWVRGLRVACRVIRECTHNTVSTLRRLLVYMKYEAFAWHPLFSCCFRCWVLLTLFLKLLLSENKGRVEYLNKKIRSGVLWGTDLQM